MASDGGGASQKQVLLLGLVMERPMYGQQLREVIEGHHDIFAAALKKPTMYYQLDRLVADGCLELRAETVDAPGPGRGHAAIAPRERDVYRITEAGRGRFFDLLRESLASFVPVASEVDVSIFFLHHLSTSEVIELLERRRAMIASTRERLQTQRASQSKADRTAHLIVDDHTFALLDAELSWIDRTLIRLRRSGVGPEVHTLHPTPI